MADEAAHEKRSPRSVPRLECLYDVIVSVRSTLGKLPARARDCAAELDLQHTPRQRIDERGISGLPGDSFVKFPIAHGIGGHVSALQGGHGFNKHIFKPSDVAVAHVRYREFDRKTLKLLVQLV